MLREKETVSWEKSEARTRRYGSGVTVVYSDQCPYIVDAVKGALEIAGEGGVEVRTVKLESSQQVRDSALSAYGVFNVVYDGKLVTYKYIDSKKERQEFLKLLDKHQEEYDEYKTTSRGGHRSLSSVPSA